MLEAVLLKEYDFSQNDSDTPKTQISNTTEEAKRPFTKGSFQGGFFIGIRSEEVRNKENESIKFASSILDRNIYQMDNLNTPNKEYKRVFTSNPIMLENVITHTYSKNGYNLDFIDSKVKRENAQFLAKNVEIINTIFEPYSVSTDIIIIDTESGEEAGYMYKKLVDERNRFELNGIIFGILLSVLCLLISVIAGIDWSATLPGAIMFLSVSGFMVLRRRLRRTTK